MSFADDINGFATDVERRVLDVHSTTVELAKQSIQFGSPITGAVGQPVDTGALRNSWMREDVSPTEAIVSTNLEYARSIEDGISSHGTPISFKSAVGGAHSVEQTVAGFDRIVAAAVQAHGGPGVG
jgi:hypothetical protein